ncbi:PA domain-containing protein [Micromonospora sp. DT228]|uniref:PA domain-containing protein n=1 Tax=Micromonospora sp. DT228 TaxID=3393443 RepID=UPI003CFAE6B3
MDEALKPDLTAPGVDVLAARSQHITWGEGFYLTDSGTSMAAPHVAAAYHQDQVIATGSVDAGLVRSSSSTQRQPIQRTITYTNTTTAPVTVDLSVDQGASPAQTFTAATDRVTVPANGTSTVDVVVDPGGLPPGRYSAQVTARWATGQVHTAVGVAVEAKKYDLTIHLKDRAGRPISGEVEIVSADQGSTFLWVPDGKLTSRWAPGSYTVVTAADVQGRNGPRSLGLAMLTVPEVDLSTNRVVELDASRAREVKVATAHPTAVTNTRIDIYRSFTATEPTPTDWNALRETFWPGAVYDSLWALPSKGRVTKGSFVLTTRIRAVPTQLEISYGGRRVSDPLVQPGARPLTDGTTRLDAVFAGNGAKDDYAGLSARGRAVVVRANDSVTPTDQAAAAQTAGAAMLVVVNDREGRKSDWYGNPDAATTGPIPVASVTIDEGEALIQKITAAGRDAVRLTVLAHPAPNTCTTWWTTTEVAYPGTRRPRPARATSPGSTSPSPRPRASGPPKHVWTSRPTSTRRDARSRWSRSRPDRVPTGCPPAATSSGCSTPTSPTGRGRTRRRSPTGRAASRRTAGSGPSPTRVYSAPRSQFAARPP